MSGTVIVDPPWAYNKSSRHKNQAGYANFHYEPLTVDDLKKLPVGTLGDYLFLWAVWPFVEAAYGLIHTWGFEPVTALTWVKTTGLTLGKELPFKPAYGVGYWFRGATEPCLIAKKSGVLSIRTPWVGLLCDNAGHSRKPDTLYEVIEKDFPGPYTELFARRQRDGWRCEGGDLGGKDIREVLHG
jgi:N6-adenosine-specific RNA methylase IME4